MSCDWLTTTSIMLPIQMVSSHPAWQNDFIDAGACNKIDIAEHVDCLYVWLAKCLKTHVAIDS